MRKLLLQSFPKLASNPIARKVKLADLCDNSDISRIAQPTEEDWRRIEKYRKAIDYCNRWAETLMRR
jgi:hypothetical protein